MIPKLLAFVAIAMLCIVPSFAADMNKSKSGWAKVPGGTVWLNAGDAYEHSTGLVRDAAGQKRYPTTPQSAQQSPSYCPTCPNYVQPYSPYVAPAVPPQVAPVYQPQPYITPPQPYFTPAPQPFYVPSQPYYMPPVGPDYGPYLPYQYPTPAPRPSSKPWGLGPYGESVDPMDVPKTGDAPLAK